MNLFRYYHSPATFAYSDRGFTVQMILPDEERDLETVDLAFTVDGNGQSGMLRMLPVDGLVLEESFSVYAATVSADALREGERLTYRFLREGEESTEYSVALTDAPDPSNVIERADLAAPAILPIAPFGRVRLASGDLSICFAVAGRERDLPTVYVKEDGAFVPYVAEPSKAGAYAVTVPFERLSRMTRLEYYIEARGEIYTASLGNADVPCVTRITDNAGPAILSTYPTEGQMLENERTPEIKLEYFDISGVNLKTSILCVDGRNVSAAANWEQGCVTYRPEKALALGEHTLEVSLRDRLGNRTYQKVTFVIADGTEGKARAGSRLGRRLSKIPTVPIRAAKLIAGAVSTLKDIFSAKE
ncbi:MAG: hypothetical protein J6B09_03235 [Clostridia bacterium]|nr:hypothetical protein [Clostridia bacterium]